MRNLSAFLATLMTCVTLLEGAASAQDTSPDTRPQVASDGNAPPPFDTLHRPYDRRDFDEVARQSRVLRNALIGTSAAFAVGVVIAGISAPQCKPTLGGQAATCDDARKALLPLGATIALVSGVGILTTSIMLGVRNKHKRDIEREIRRRYTVRRLRFDEKSGGLVF